MVAIATLVVVIATVVVLIGKLTTELGMVMEEEPLMVGFKIMVVLGLLVLQLVLVIPLGSLNRLELLGTEEMQHHHRLLEE